jgi:hypothetical protein
MSSTFGLDDGNASPEDVRFSDDAHFLTVLSKEYFLLLRLGSSYSLFPSNLPLSVIVGTTALFI